MVSPVFKEMLTLQLWPTRGAVKMGAWPHRKALLQISLHGTRLNSSPCQLQTVAFDEDESMVTVELDSSVGSILLSFEMSFTGR